MLPQTEYSDTLPQPKYLWFFMVSFSMVIAISNWYDARLVSLFGFTISPGALTFPFSFLVADTITEVYGYKQTRLAIWTALFFNLLFICFGQMVIHLPSPNFETQNEAFDKLLSMNFKIVCASFVSYLFSEPLSSMIMAKLKMHFQGKYMGMRFILSTVVAAFLDSVLFISIAFYNEVPFINLLQMMLNIWLVKSAVEIIFVPVSVRLTKWVKDKEKLDVYDYKTNFNIFKLDSSYEQNANHYYQHTLSNHL